MFFKKRKAKEIAFDDTIELHTTQLVSVRTKAQKLAEAVDKKRKAIQEQIDEDFEETAMRLKEK